MSIERYASTSDRSPDMDYAEDGAYVFYSDYQDLERQLAEKDKQLAEAQRKIDLAIKHISGEAISKVWVNYPEEPCVTLIEALKGGGE